MRSRRLGHEAERDGYRQAVTAGNGESQLSERCDPAIGQVPVAEGLTYLASWRFLPRSLAISCEGQHLLVDSLQGLVLSREMSQNDAYRSEERRVGKECRS